MKKLFALFAAVLMLQGVHAAALPQICLPLAPETDIISQATQGHLKLAGNICYTLDASGQQPTQINWAGKLTFNNFAPPNAPGFNANGVVDFNLGYNLAANTLNVAYNGPVTFVYQGLPYNVVFNNVVIDLATGQSGVTPGKASGTVSINGVIYPAGTWLWAYLF